MSRELMTRAEYAARRGVTPNRVSMWKRSGLIVYADDGTGRMLIDVARTEAKINAAIDPTRGRPTSAQASVPANALPPATDASARDGGQQLVADVRVDLIKQQTIAKRMQIAREAGQLVPFAEYQARAEKFGRLARERVQAMARAMAERLAAEHEPRAIMTLLSDEIDAVFARLAETAETDDGDEDVEAIDAAGELDAVL